MKIHVLDLQLTEDDQLDLIEVNSLKKAEKLGINTHYYLFFRALQFNKDFASEIKKLRKKHNIDLKKYDYKTTLFEGIREVAYAKSTRPISKKLRKIEKDAQKIVKKFRHRNTLSFERVIPGSISEIILTGALVIRNISPIRIDHDPLIDEES
ncbi:MAG: hypothetical protein GF390_02565, partial [Candidatus Pacebacteria bacterium]|nr:hypothetical protein [Candidatus Paceibacterota bacterium]